MLETNRLLIKPLNYHQLMKYASCDNSLEQELRVKTNPRTISPELMEAIHQTFLPRLKEKPPSHLFSTLWTAISKTEQKIVGDLCIVDEPNAKGEIEIGYGTHAAFEGQGYMTEIVSGIIRWASIQNMIKAITATTNKTNTGSIRVLEKNHFFVVAETDTSLHWYHEIRI